MLTQYLTKFSEKMKPFMGFTLNKKNSTEKQYKKLIKQLQKDKALFATGSLETALQIANMFKARSQSAAEAYCEIATFFVNSGHPELAQKYHLASLKLAMSPGTYSLYLQCLMLSPTCNEKKMFEAAAQYQKLFLNHITPYTNHNNEKNSNRRLNIGYICHFFHNCVSKSLLIPYLAAHNRDRVKVFCYSDGDPNEVPDYIKQTPEVWRDTKELDDEALSNLIREDKIDILLELNGHIVVNRYLCIARKPAPIQISFYNIAATTGISAIDYVLVGDEMSLAKVDSYYTESVYYFKGVCGVAQFSDSFPDVAKEPPCFSNQYITFGSFGGAQKVNKEVVKLWCKVLKAVPHSRFYMKAGVLTFDAYIKSYQLLFEAEGIDLNRITFEGFSAHHEMLECYAKVDIALDTFPHGAGTTTMEATWMGVPVLSLYGDRHCMQHGKAILGSVGHLELIAYSEEEFVKKAVELAADPNRLRKYRQQLRADFKKSPRADVRSFANTLEDAYFDIWQKYCASNQ